MKSFHKTIVMAIAAMYHEVLKSLCERDGDHSIKPFLRTDQEYQDDLAEAITKRCQDPGAAVKDDRDWYLRGIINGMVAHDPDLLDEFAREADEIEAEKLEAEKEEEAEKDESQSQSESEGEGESDSDESGGPSNPSGDSNRDHPQGDDSGEDDSGSDPEGPSQSGESESNRDNPQ